MQLQEKSCYECPAMSKVNPSKSFGARGLSQQARRNKKKEKNEHHTAMEPPAPKPSLGCFGRGGMEHLLPQTTFLFSFQDYSLLQLHVFTVLCRAS